MTEKEINKDEERLENTFRKLSIQVSLNGLSFCIVDTLSKKVVLTEQQSFRNTLTPFLVQKELEIAFKKHQLLEAVFDEVIVIHKNPFFSLVPKTFFNLDQIRDYLKFNTKVLDTDEVVHDELSHAEIMNVYIPFTNINNYIFGLYGTFEYKHTASVLIPSLIQQYSLDQNHICYVHVGHKEMELLVFSRKNLVLYNYFEYETQEDFLYYLLFALEQLDMDLETIPVRLFGTVDDQDELHTLCQTYIKNVAIFKPSDTEYPFKSEGESIDFTVFNTL